MGMLFPGVEPARQEMPELSTRREGTSTLKFPFLSACRKGFSRMRGVLAILVIDWAGQFSTGGLTSPTNTIFQFAPSQRPNSEFLENHCCCEPVLTLPSTRSSDIQPPLE